MLIRLLLPLLVLPLAAAAATAAGPEAASGFILIGNRTGLESPDATAVRSIFRGDQAIWPTRETVVVVLPSARADFGDRFAEQILQQTRTGMQRHWLALVFQGRARSPVFLDSAAAIVEFVRKTPGAVAMVPASENGIPRELMVSQRR
jgi:hypothetical protein